MGIGTQGFLCKFLSFVLSHTISCLGLLCLAPDIQFSAKSFPVRVSTGSPDIEQINTRSTSEIISIFSLTIKTQPCTCGLTSFCFVIPAEKPKILNSLPSYSPLLRGKTAVLSCYGVADPSPSITWTKDGSSHIPRGTIHADGHVLVISDVSARDQGVYRCMLSNYLGSAMSSTNLTIIGNSRYS